MCVARKREECERERGLHFCMSARGICVVALNMQKASITQAGNNPSHDDGVTSFWNRPSGLQGQPGGLRGFLGGLKCLGSPSFIAMDTQKPTDCLRDGLLENIAPHLMTFGGFLVFF